MEDSVEVARRLGTEHGTRAAEEWLAESVANRIGLPPDQAAVNRLKAAGEYVGWPQPDLDAAQEASIELFTDAELGSMLPESVVLADAYSAAFTAAVEATIRQVVQS